MAERLGTGKSGEQCRQQYETVVVNKVEPTKTSPEQENDSAAAFAGPNTGNIATSAAAKVSKGRFAPRNKGAQSMGKAW